MRLIIQGLNVNKMSTDRIEICNIDQGFCLDDFYITFDSIYQIKKKDSSLVPFILDHNTNSFKILYDPCDFQLFSACSDSNFFWCLVQDESDLKIKILKFTNKILASKFELIQFSSKDINDLVILSTDVNTYIFKNNTEGLKCIFELKDKNDFQKETIEQEKKLNENCCSSFPLNKILINEKINQFSTGKEHLVLLTEKTKQIYTCGIGTKGQIGHGKIENSFEPKLIDIPCQNVLSISSGNCGWHSALLDNESNCFLWGWNSHGQVGDTEHDSAFVTKPMKLIIKDELTDKTIKLKKVSLGARHTCLLDLNGNVYTFGWNKYLQCWPAKEEEEEIFEPIKLLEFENKVKDIKSGCWNTVLLLDD